MTGTSVFSQSEITIYKQGIEYAKLKNWNMAKSKFIDCLLKDGVDNVRKRDGSKYIQYFPNRELGVVYSYLGDYERASYYLQKSISQSSSNRAYQKLKEVAQKVEELKRNEQRKKDRNAWYAATSKGTIGAYEDYARNYPEGNYINTARSKISALKEKERESRQEESAWNNAKSRNTIRAFQAYLDDYPAGKFASAAKNRIFDLKQLAIKQRKGYYEMLETYAEPEIIK